MVLRTDWQGEEDCVVANRKSLLQLELSIDLAPERIFIPLYCKPETLSECCFETQHSAVIASPPQRRTAEQWGAGDS